MWRHSSELEFDFNFYLKSKSKKINELELPKSPGCLGLGGPMPMPMRAARTRTQKINPNPAGRRDEQTDKERGIPAGASTRRAKEEIERKSPTEKGRIWVHGRWERAVAPSTSPAKKKSSNEILNRHVRLRLKKYDCFWRRGRLLLRVLLLSLRLALGARS